MMATWFFMYRQEESTMPTDCREALPRFVSEMHTRRSTLATILRVGLGLVGLGTGAARIPAGAHRPIVRFKQHKDNPTQVPVLSPVAPIERISN